MATNYKTIAQDINKVITDTHKMASKVYSLSPFVKDKDLIKLEMIKNALLEAKKICELPLEKIIDMPKAKEDKIDKQTDKEIKEYTYSESNPSNMEEGNIRAELDSIGNRLNKGDKFNKEEVKQLFERRARLMSELEEREAKKKE
jgi:hypothetical protein